MYPAKYWKRFIENPFANNKYILKKYLGSGAFGAVFLADEVIADRLIRQVAIKLVEVETHPDNDTEIDSVDLDKKIKELQLSVQLQHPCLINCHTVEQDTLDDYPFLGLVMEIAQISLETYQKDNSLSEEELKEIIKAIALGLDYLHGQNIVHRDIKPANILKVKNQWKIGDFGVSFLLDKGKTIKVRTSQKMGTQHYASPETCNGLVSKASDVWSFGIMTCELVTGQHPFPYATTEQLLYKIYNEEPELSNNLQSPYREIITGCLIKDHQQRWTTQQVLEALNESSAESPFRLQKLFGDKYKKLQDLLAHGKWKDADLETQQLMFGEIGECCFSPAKMLKLSCEHIRIIDNLWIHYSNGRFGFSVQQKIWEKVSANISDFARTLGWVKNNDRVICYNDVNFSLLAPVGHLPCFKGGFYTSGDTALLHKGYDIDDQTYIFLVDFGGNRGFFESVGSYNKKTTLEGRCEYVRQELVKDFEVKELELEEIQTKGCQRIDDVFYLDVFFKRFKDCCLV